MKKKLPHNFKIDSYKKINEWVKKNNPSVILVNEKQFKQYGILLGLRSEGMKGFDRIIATYNGIPFERYEEKRS